MADFTVEGIIDVDASRGIRGVRKFKNELKELLADLKAVDRAIKDIDGSEIDVKVDVNGLEDIERAKQAVDSLDDENVKVNIDVAADAAEDARRMLADLEMAARDGIDIPVELDGVDAMRDAAQLREEIEAMTDRDVIIDLEMERADEVIREARQLRAEIDAALGDVEVGVDVDRSGIDKLKQSLGGVTSAIGSGAGTSGLIAAVIALIAVLGPLGGVLAGVGAAGLGAFGVLGTAAGAFGVIAAPAIKEVAGAIKLLNTNTEEMTSEELAEYNTAVKEFKQSNPLIWEAAQGFTTLKENYLKWAEQLKPAVIDMLSSGLRILNTLLGYAGPIALEAGDAFAGLFRDMALGLKTDDWANFFGYVEENAQFFIQTWGRAVGNFITGIANMIVAFDPLTKFFSKGLLGMSRDFREWSSNLGESEDFKSFVNFVKENAPLVKSVLGGLVDAIINLVEHLAPLGVTVLENVDNFLKWYNALSETNPEAAQMLTTGAALVAVLSPLAGVVGPLVGVFTGLAGALLPVGGAGTAAAGGIGATGAAGTAAAGGVGAFALGLAAVAAAVALVAGGIAFLSPQTESYAGMMESLKSLWEKVVEVGKDLWDMVKEGYEILEDSGAIDQFQQAFTKLFDALETAMPILKPILFILGGSLLVALIALAYALNIAATGFKMLVDAVAWVVDKIVSLFKWLYDVLVGHSIIPDMINAIIEWFGKLPGKLAELIGRAVGWVVGKFKEMGGKVKDAVTNLKNAAVEKFTSMAGSVRDKAGQAKEFVTTKFSEMKTAAVERFTSMRASVAEKMGSMAGSIRDKAGQAKTYLTTKFSEAKTSVISKSNEMKVGAVSKFAQIVIGAREKFGQIKGVITGAFSGAAGWLSGIGKSIMDGLIGGVQRGADVLRGVLGGITSSIPDWKGPRDRDKVLLRPAGQYIMGGLIGGVVSQENALKNELANVTKMFSRDMTAPFGVTKTMPGIGAGPLTESAMLASGSGGITNFYEIIADIPVNADQAEVGRAIMKAIEEYERAGGRKKRKGASR